MSSTKFPLTLGDSETVEQMTSFEVTDEISQNIADILRYLLGHFEWRNLF